tara:strand:- start:4133 stop:5635 length:1503 start_codon:yes stop_codon:yes gene_type:complete
MKILDKSQIQEADRQTIAMKSISSFQLMESAAKACRDWIVNRFDNNQHFSFICGTGNNGGDGLTLYRLLMEKNYPCILYEFPVGDNPTEEYLENKRKIEADLILKLTPEAFSSISNKDIIIDGLLGTGINRPVIGELKKVIQSLNALPNTIISIDIPSGLFSEYNSNNPGDGILQANFTLSFQMPKLAFLLPEQGEKAGQFHLLDIGLNTEFIEKVKTPYHYLTTKKANSLFKLPKKFDHKGKNGHHLLVAGSKGKMGAAILAAKGSLRSGVGKLSILTPQSGIEVLQNSIPESMIEFNNGINCLSGYYNYNFNTISLGPGIGTSNETAQFVFSLLSKTQAQMVIDADAINILANKPKWIKKLPKNTILTPHPKEFERLVGSWQNDQEKLEHLSQFCQKYHLICILKGAHTAIAFPNRTLWFNSTGNPGMAKAGSGDVLTGIIGGLLAKGYPPQVAALLGVYAHGRSGDLKLKSHSSTFLISSDLISGLSEVWKEMQESS